MNSNIRVRALRQYWQMKRRDKKKTLTEILIITDSAGYLLFCNNLSATRSRVVSPSTAKIAFYIITSTMFVLKNNTKKIIFYNSTIEFCKVFKGRTQKVRIIHQFPIVLYLLILNVHLYLLLWNSRNTALLKK